MAAASGFPDLMTVLVNIGEVIPPFLSMLQIIAGVAGLYLTAAALVEMWGVSHDGAMKYVSGKNRFSWGSALIQMVIGSLLIAMSTMEIVGILSRTLTENYANSKMLSYSGGTASSFAEKAKMATMALLGIMQVVGFIAMFKGWLTVNRYYNGQSQAGLGQAAGWLIGGIVAWNFKWFADMLNNTLGFNIIGLFTPF